MKGVVELIRSERLYPGVPYAYAATAPAGTRFIFLAGSCPLSADGATAALGDYRGQAVQALANLRTALSDASARLTDVIFSRVLVATSERSDLVAVWDVVAEAFGPHDVPSTLVGVSVLGYPDQMVEIEAIAAVPADASTGAG
jgi:enamine deaminase RidA (YjgF/YER057c/UK114 family)